MSLREHLPLGTSIEETARDWPKMSRTQKLGASAASIVTVSGPILRYMLESQRGQQQDITPTQFIAQVAIDLRDKLDGTIARATDGVTPLGKELDPLMDKFDFAIQEIYQNRRGELPLGQLAVRLARDIAVTVLRAHVSAATHGEADISANWYGKASTTARLASLRITGLPGERDHPRFRTIHQTAATGLIVISGAKNIKDLLDAKAEYMNGSDEI